MELYKLARQRLQNYLFLSSIANSSRKLQTIPEKKWNVMTRIWRGSNVSFFAALCCSCLDLKALLALLQLDITAYLPSRCRREAIRAVISSL